MPTVFANGRSIVHAGDGQINIAAPPDVCKTPSPGGPVPVPYVNIAKSSDLADGTKKVKIEGKSVGLESSNLSTSTGDEPGSVGGLISSKTKGKLTWGTKSLDVKFEGKSVVRFMDVVQHNGNTFNTAFIENGRTGWAYGDDFEGPCAICAEPAEKHRIYETANTAEKAKQLIDALKNAQRQYFSLQQERENLQGELDELKAEFDTVEKALAVLPAEELSEEMAHDKQAMNATKKTLNAKIKAKGKEVRTKAGEIGKQRVHKDQGTGGYMVGVMLCKVHFEDKTFAAMSGGGKSLAGFKKVVEDDLGWELVDKGATQADFKNVSPRQFSDSKKSDTFGGRWNDCDSKFNDEGAVGYNKPGECAAAKLLTKSDHAPLSMSEMFFSPKQPEHKIQFTYKHVTRLRTLLKVLTLGQVDWTTTTRWFGEGETVPSCNTCKELLPAALCDIEERSC